MSSTPGGCFQLSRECPALSAALTFRKCSQRLHSMSVEWTRAGLPDRIPLGFQAPAACPVFCLAKGSDFLRHPFLRAGASPQRHWASPLSRRQCGSESHGAVRYGPSKDAREVQTRCSQGRPRARMLWSQHPEREELSLRLPAALALHWLARALQVDPLDFLLKSARTVLGKGKRLLPLRLKF